MVFYDVSSIVFKNRNLVMENYCLVVIIVFVVDTKTSEVGNKDGGRESFGAEIEGIQGRGIGLGWVGGTWDTLSLLISNLANLYSESKRQKKHALVVS